MIEQDVKKAIFAPGRVRVGGSSLRGIPSTVKGGGGQGQGRGGGMGGGKGSGKGGGKGSSSAAVLSQLQAIVALGASSAPPSRGVVSPPDVAGALTLLSTQTVSGSPAAITFSGISQAYNDLVIEAILRSTAGSSATDDCRMELNADTTDANYRYAVNWNAGTTPTSSQNSVALIAFSMPAGLGDANVFGAASIELFGYTSTTWQKQALCLWGTAFTAGSQRAGSHMLLWRNTAAVTQIVLKPNTAATWAVGSTARLYGRL